MSAAVSASSSSSGGAGAGAGGGGGAAVQQVVEALRVLHQDPNPQAKEKANAWLAEFQKSVSQTGFLRCGARLRAISMEQRDGIRTC